METRGQPRAFKNEEDFKNKFVEYIKYCDEKGRLANIAGFAVYCDINRDTFYNQKELYPNAFDKIQNILEDYTLNADVHYVLKMFYLKCKFSYKDGREAESKNNSRITIVDDLPDGDDNE